MTKVKTICANGVTMLTDEQGTPMRCAWIAPIAVPGKLAGSISLMEQTCDSRCPFLELLPNSVVLHCVRAGAPEPEGFALEKFSSIPIAQA